MHVEKPQIDEWKRQLISDSLRFIALVWELYNPIINMFYEFHQFCKK